MNIGEAASVSGVSAKTIRYYEAARLITPTNRTDGGYRVYTQADVLMLRFIRRARDLGFSIERIRRLVDLWQDKSRASADVKRLALDHIAEIRAKIAAMTTMRRSCHLDSGQRSRSINSRSSLSRAAACSSDRSRFRI